MASSNYIVPKRSREIVNKFVSWLESNLTDPYEQVSGKTRTGFVISKSIPATYISPILQLKLNPFSSEKIATQDKTQPFQIETHTIMFYYYNEKDKRYTFSDTSLTLTDEAQAQEYLEYVRNRITANATAFDDYCSNISFGTISQPRWNPQSRSWITSMPMNVKTYRMKAE